MKVYLIYLLRVLSCFKLNSFSQEQNSQCPTFPDTVLQVKYLRIPSSVMTLTRNTSSILSPLGPHIEQEGDFEIHLCQYNVPGLPGTFTNSLYTQTKFLS